MSCVIGAAAFAATFPSSSLGKKKKLSVREVPATAPATQELADPPGGVPTDAPPEMPVEKPKIAGPKYAVAFPISPELLVTAARSLEDAAKISALDSFGNSHDVEVVRIDTKIGLALLRIGDVKMEYLPFADAFGGGAFQCASIQKANVFSPTVDLVDGTSQKAETNWQITIKQQPHVSGGALIVDKKVVGVQLGTAEDEQDTLEAATLDDLKKFVGSDAPQRPGSGDASTASMEVIATPK